MFTTTITAPADEPLLIEKNEYRRINLNKFNQESEQSEIVPQLKYSYQLVPMSRQHYRQTILLEWKVTFNHQYQHSHRARGDTMLKMKSRKFVRITNKKQYEIFEICITETLNYPIAHITLFLFTYSNCIYMIHL